MYKLVIAEKPSVAMSIAKVIGATNKKEGYLEGAGYLVSWCVGHLVELTQPEGYDAKYEKWRYTDLPIIPGDWLYQVSQNTKDQFQILKELMHRKDVESLIEATDAGREGELIFRLVYQQAGCKKPFYRLWISSMEDTAIKEGMVNVKPGKEYDALYEAALCRERADWLVGMNGTRLFSTLYGQTLQVGRVMTPTLAMLVMREAEISGFKPETFYKVAVTVNGITAESERISDKEKAEALLKKVQEGEVYVRKNKISEKKEKPPLLYDLTSLQREANRRYGFTAQQTLDYLQSLYEKKLVTYPRTDSRFLTEDMEAQIPKLAKEMYEKFGLFGIPVMNTKQVINSKKVSDHHAILPTGEVKKASFGELPKGEQKVLTLVVARFLAAIGKAAIYQEGELLLEAGGEIFLAKAKKRFSKGYQEIEDFLLGTKKEEKQKAQSFDVLEEGNTYPVETAQITEGKTVPKKHFTEDTLLSFMERAGAEEMPDEAEKKGIGTPATRAGIIEKLVRIGLVERKGDKKTLHLIPTHKGTALITVIPEALQSPSMTADWEEKLCNIEKGAYKGDAFMDEIADMIRELVKTYQVVEGAEVLMHPVKEKIGDCPICGKKVVEGKKGFYCENRECNFALWKENRFFDSLSKKLDKQVAVKLLKDGKAYLKGCRSVKTGKVYDATVMMTVAENKKLQFHLSFGK
ncbi:MAG: DNA topoisomerase 3 [Lachnospiraceae bacterium]|nr:DNA topoisomerase 3 [Lachnospiraceae bacterium]